MKVTKIYRSRKDSIIKISAYLISIGLGIYLYLFKHSIKLRELIIGFILFILLLFYEIKKYLVKEPQLIITNLGIEIFSKGLINWKEIRKIEVSKNEYIEEPESYELTVATDSKTYSTIIDNLDTNPWDLAKLIEIYTFKKDWIQLSY